MHKLILAPRVWSFTRDPNLVQRAGLCFFCTLPRLPRWRSSHQIKAGSAAETQRTSNSPQFTVKAWRWCSGRGAAVEVQRSAAYLSKRFLTLACGCASWICCHCATSSFLNWNSRSSFDAQQKITETKTCCHNNPWRINSSLKGSIKLIILKENYKWSKKADSVHLDVAFF